MPESSARGLPEPKVSQPGLRGLKNVAVAPFSPPAERSQGGLLNSVVFAPTSQSVRLSSGSAPANQSVRLSSGSAPASHLRPSSSKPVRQVLVMLCSRKLLMPKLQQSRASGSRLALLQQASTLGSGKPTPGSSTTRIRHPHQIPG